MAGLGSNRSGANGPPFMKSWMTRLARGANCSVGLWPAGTEAVAISLWENKENAEAYSRDTYPAVLRTLERMVEGTPAVDSYEVSNSTFHKIASRNPNQSQPVAR